MKPATELIRVSSTAAVWQHYDAAVKADLWSTAIRTNGGVYIIDPIELVEDECSELLDGTSLRGIFVTNENHFRAAPQICRRHDVQLLLHSRLADVAPENVRMLGLREGEQIENGAVEVMEIGGAPRGEIALLHRAAGEIVIGDALINFAPHGFTLLPDKYCTNPREMRRALRKLLDVPFQRMFFAHGMPITENADVRLRQLLDG